MRGGGGEDEKFQTLCQNSHRVCCVSCGTRDRVRDLPFPRDASPGSPSLGWVRGQGGGRAAPVGAGVPRGSLVWFAVACVVYVGLMCPQRTDVKIWPLCLLGKQGAAAGRDADSLFQSSDSPASIYTNTQCCFGKFLSKEFWLKICAWFFFFFSENLKQ